MKLGTLINQRHPEAGQVVFNGRKFVMEDKLANHFDHIPRSVEPLIGAMTDVSIVPTIDR